MRDLIFCHPCILTHVIFFISIIKKHSEDVGWDVGCGNGNPAITTSANLHQSADGHEDPLMSLDMRASAADDGQKISDQGSTDGSDVEKSLLSRSGLS